MANIAEMVNELQQERDRLTRLLRLWHRSQERVRLRQHEVERVGRVGPCPRCAKKSFARAKSAVGETTRGEFREGAT